MKKMLFVVSILCLSWNGMAQDQIISFAKLPVKSQNFISKYFDTSTVDYIKLDDDYFSKEYEVVLRNGTKVEFDGNGEWKEIDGKRSAIPTKLIPTTILNYVTKSFPNNQIKKIERKKRGYEVELTNGLDLIFNAKGNFVKIDD